MKCVNRDITYYRMKLYCRLLSVTYCFRIMPWSAIQRQRLDPIDPTGDTKVEVRVTCSNDKQHTLRVYLPSDYPNSVPDMIVKTPGMTTLKSRSGGEMCAAITAPINVVNAASTHLTSTATFQRGHSRGFHNHIGNRVWIV